MKTLKYELVGEDELVAWAKQTIKRVPEAIKPSTAFCRRFRATLLGIHSVEYVEDGPMLAA
jgi:hypothetical protein